jgi:hypothetical protein
MTDARTTPREGVHLVRLVESPVETSAVDRRYDYVPAPKPRAVVMRPTTQTQFVVTSAIDLRDDVLRDEVPGIVGDSCFGALGPAHDAIVQAIEQEDTKPIRRLAAGTTPPELAGNRIDRGAASELAGNRIRRGAASELREAAARRDVAAVLRALDAAHDGDLGAAHDDAGHDRDLGVADDDAAHADAAYDAAAHDDAAHHDVAHHAAAYHAAAHHDAADARIHDGGYGDSLDHRSENGGDDPLAMTFARGSSPSLDRAIAFARGSSTSLDGTSVARGSSTALDGTSIARGSSTSLDGTSIARGSSTSLDATVRAMARGISHDGISSAPGESLRMTMSRDGGSR